MLAKSFYAGSGGSRDYRAPCCAVFFGLDEYRRLEICRAIDALITLTPDPEEKRDKFRATTPRDAKKKKKKKTSYRTRLSVRNGELFFAQDRWNRNDLSRNQRLCSRCLSITVLKKLESRTRASSGPGTFVVTHFYIRVIRSRLFYARNGVDLQRDYPVSRALPSTVSSVSAAIVHSRHKFQRASSILHTRTEFSMQFRGSRFCWPLIDASYAADTARWHVLGISMPHRRDYLSKQALQSTRPFVRPLRHDSYGSTASFSSFATSRNKKNTPRCTESIKIVARRVTTRIRYPRCELTRRCRVKNRGALARKTRYRSLSKNKDSVRVPRPFVPDRSKCESDGSERIQF